MVAIFLAVVQLGYEHITIADTRGLLNSIYQKKKHPFLTGFSIISILGYVHSRKPQLNSTRLPNPTPSVNHCYGIAPEILHR